MKDYIYEVMSIWLWVGTLVVRSSLTAHVIVLWDILSFLCNLFTISTVSANRISISEIDTDLAWIWTHDFYPNCCSKIEDEVLINLILGLQIRVRNKRKKHTFFLISQPKYMLGTQRAGSDVVALMDKKTK